MSHRPHTFLGGDQVRRRAGAAAAVLFVALFTLVLCRPQVGRAAERKDRVLLVLVTMQGNENLQGFLIDPELQRQFEARGWRIEGRGIEEVTREHFAAADAVVVLQEPYAVNVPGVAAWRRMLPEFDRYLRDGGGAMVIFDDRYFQVFGPMNELLERYGARVVREAVVDRVERHATRLANDDGVVALETHNLNREHPITAGLAAMAWPQTEGGKDSYPLVASPEWTPLVRAEATAHSEDVWATDRHRSFAAEPVLAAARSVGAGRLVYFGAHSSLTFLHGSHPRWDDGYFLRHGDAEFFGRALEWLDEAPARARGTMPALQGNPSPTTDLLPVAQDAQQPVSTWQPGVIVLLEKEPQAVADWVEALRGRLSWIALVLPDSALPKQEDYARWQRVCREASNAEFLVVPGATLRDRFRNPAAILNPQSWPVKVAAPTINHMAREIGGHPVLLSPGSNPWPTENIGGFQGYALAEYDGGRLVRFNLAEFRRLQAEDWFLVPQVVFSHVTPAGLAAAMAERAYRTLVPASSPAEVPLKFPFLFHNERNIVVSRGPVVRQAGLVGEHLIEDPWEGRYYLWSGPADRAAYALDVDGLEAGSEVRVHRDHLLWRRYLPGAGRWHHAVDFASTEALHSYWTEIWRAGELEAISSVSRSRNFTNWAHGGGDRMNLYHSVMRADARGGLLVHGERLTGFGSLLFNEGWGDTATIRPTLDWFDLYPAGHEWGIPTGGVEYLRFSPQVQAGNQREYLVSKPARIGYAAAGESGAVLRETIDRKEATVDGVRTVQPAELIKVRTSYTIPVWERLGPISIIVDTDITARRDLDLGSDPQIQLLEFVGRSKGRFANVAVGGSAGPAATTSLIKPGERQGRHEGRWFMLAPDPLGAVIVGGLGDGEFLLTAETTSKGPRVRFSIRVSERLWRAGETKHVRFGFALTSGREPDPVAVATEAMALWTGGKRLFSEVTPAVGRTWLGYPCADLAATPAVRGVITDVKRALPLAMEFASGSERIPVYASFAGARAPWVPLVQDRDRAYATIATNTHGAFGAGRIVKCEDPELQFDVKELSSAALEVWVHNPTLATKTAAVSPSGLMPLTGGQVSVTLRPGEERVLTFPFHE